MKIGIISDTHDDVENVQRAIEMFNVESVADALVWPEFFPVFDWQYCS